MQLSAHFFLGMMMFFNHRIVVTGHLTHNTSWQKITENGLVTLFQQKGSPVYESLARRVEPTNFLLFGMEMNSRTFLKYMLASTPGETSA